MILVDDNNNSNGNDKVLKADIRVIGVGGGGGNAVETMIKEGIEGVQFISINTDSQALQASSADIKIQLGEKLTKGLGAGANPEIGRRAAMESYEEIVSKLEGADMVFITAGMGGGTGTGGAPIVAEVARDLGILTVGIVTYPFGFEGNRRKKYADQGIADLKKHVDTLIIIPNEKLLAIAEEDTPLQQTFQKTDEVLLQAIKGIAELVSVQGLINLDFADVKTVMANQGMALMSIGFAEGKDRAQQAVAAACSSPLLADLSIEGSRGMIVNIRAGSNLSLSEVNKATSCLTDLADDDAEIIVGAVIDESMGNKLSITLIATGFNEGASKSMESLSEQLKAESKTEMPIIEEPDEIADEDIEEENLGEESHEETQEAPSMEDTQEFKPVQASEEAASEEDTEIKEEHEEENHEDEEEDTHVISASEESEKDHEEEKHEEPQGAIIIDDEQEGIAIVESTESNTDIEAASENDETDFEESSEAIQMESSKEEMSLRDKILLKAKEHSEAIQKKEEEQKETSQLDIDWEASSEDNLEDDSYSPFEPSVELAEEDL